MGGRGEGRTLHSCGGRVNRTKEEERERKDNFFEFRTFCVIHMLVSFCAFAPMTTVVFGQTSTKLLTENLLN